MIKREHVRLAPYSLASFPRPTPALTLLPFSGEALNQTFSRILNGGDLYWEPELEAGGVAAMLSEPGSRVLEVGQSAGATRFSRFVI